MENDSKTVVSMDASKLDSLAKRVRNGIELRHQSDDEWIQATLDLSAALAEAKEYFGGNLKLFGQWCDESGFDISHQDRAVYIAFGQNMERAREILNKTESRSIRIIHQKEFRFTNAGKTAKVKTGPTTAPKLQKALDAYDAFKAAGVEPTQGQVMDKAGVSATIVQKAVERRLTEAELAKQEPDLSGFSLSAKAKVEAAVRKIQKRMDVEYEWRVRDGIRKHIAEHIMPTYGKKLEMADRILATGRKPFSIPEFRKLLAALHPDSSSVEVRTEMFMIVKERELILRPAEKDRPLSGDLPKTIEELLARRRKK